MTPITSPLPNRLPHSIREARDAHHSAPSVAIFFLSLFLLLLFRSELRGSLPAKGDATRLPYPVQLFSRSIHWLPSLQCLATHALYRGLLWSLVILLPTFFLGRFFCGWIARWARSTISSDH